jgi:hypothetical protein
MENFKIDSFLKENTENIFPNFEKLSQEKCLALKKTVY